MGLVPTQAHLRQATPIQQNRVCRGPVAHQALQGTKDTKFPDTTHPQQSGSFGQNNRISWGFAFPHIRSISKQAFSATV